MIIKVCGMRHAQNIREVEALGIDLMGFIFSPRSKRYVAERPEYLPAQCKRVGVFVNADIQFITQHVSDFGLDYVQLHGAETPDQCRQLRKLCPHAGIIKAFSIKNSQSLLPTAQYEGLADYLLFDTPTVLDGGSGRTFDHTLLSHYTGHTPFLLSGGLSLDNLEQTLQFSHPMLAGYDLNSRFEIQPALKDPLKLKQYINTIRHNQHNL